MKAFSLLLILALFFPLNFALAQTTNSEKYRFLEIDSPKTQKMRKDAIAQSNAAFAQSPNFKAAETIVRRISDQPRTMKTQRIAGGQILELVDTGMNKPVQLILTRADGFKKTIFQSTSLPANALLLGFTVSPDASVVSLVVSLNGSVDKFLQLFLNLSDLKLMSGVITTHLPTLVWTEPNQFLVNRYTEELSEIVDQYTLPNLSKASSTMFGTLSGGGSTGTLVVKKTAAANVGQNFIISPKGLLPMDDPDFTSLVSFQETKLIYLAKGIKTPSELREYRLDPTTEKSTSHVLYRFENEVIKGAQALSGGDGVPNLFALTTHWGPQQTITLIDETGKVLTRIAVPEFCSPSGVSWKTPGRILTIALQSAVVENGEFSYDIKAQRFIGTTPADRMLSLNGKKFETYMIDVKSQDGTKIPTRLTHVKYLPRNAKHPVVFSTYGGYGSPSGIYPNYGALELDFMLRGGVIVAAGVRGGNEFGAEWYQAGVRENKTKTFEDVAAVAQTLTASGITDASLITLTGGSNGGLVVSATALMFPKAFGLVIPFNGLIDMLAKERLDARFSDGWSYEYGDSRKPADLKYLAAYSPLEQARKGVFPNFLVVNGWADSRVHPSHSLKLYAALTDANKQPSSYVRLVSIKQSGHMSWQPGFQDLPGWRSQAAIWAAIYDQAGWNVRP